MPAQRTDENWGLKLLIFRKKCWAQLVCQ